MSSTDRTKLGARAIKFLDAPAFDAHYRKIHPARSRWVFACLIHCLTIVGLPLGVRGLLKQGKIPFDSARLRRAYRRLAETGRVVRAHVVMGSSALRAGPTACAPALVV